MMKRLLRGGARSSAPQHYSGARVVSARAFSHARSLTAAAVAVAMMASVAVTAFIPTYSANAEGAAGDNGGICTPQSITLGTDTGHSTEDTGVATYVGGDMYVGKKTGGNMLDVNGPSGSYAVEAEGLTAVKGKLLMHPLKGAWATYFTDADGAKNGYVKDYRGFRFGVVGFGGQYRPKDGSVVLDVKGDSNDSSIGWVKGTQAWGNAGWVGKNKNTEPSYSANIAGDSTTVYGGSSNQILGNGSKNTDTNRYDSRNSVYVPGGMEGTVSWKQTDETIGSTNEKFSDFDTYIKKLSNDLSSLKGFGSVYVTTATYSSDSYNNLKRTKYDVNEYDNGSYTFTINNVNEKVIKFQGDGKASMQVFNLPASFLNDSSSYTGVSFDFSGIPDSASVVINVTGKNVDFHNGWRFWWTDESGTKRELGGSYADSEYAKRAQQIMWNFADATNVVIHGGQGSGTTTRRDANSNLEKADGVWDKSFAMETKDDPAAGMLGSILVPNGSFESHVSTNGRVWVGGDFSMYNPDAVGNTNNGTFYKFLNYERSYSASALDMDQERHNLPWNGSYSTQCAVIQINKVDNNDNALAGTTWGVYKTYADAANGGEAITTVTDGNALSDKDGVDNGTIQVGNLKTNSNYYLKELGAPKGYQISSKVYRITAGDQGSLVQDVYESADGTNWTPVSDNKIVNYPQSASISWTKNGEDDKPLADSSWEITANDGRTYIVEDNMVQVSSVTILKDGVDAGDSLSITQNSSATLTAQVQPANAAQDVKWESSNSAVATVSDGTVTGIAPGTAVITVKPVGDDSISDSITVTVTAVQVTSLTVKTGNMDVANNASFSLSKGNYQRFTATVDPANTAVSWTSSAESVATVDSDGKVTAVASGTVTITAKAGSLSVSFTVTVPKDTHYTVIYFNNPGKWSTPYLWYSLDGTDGSWREAAMTRDYSSNNCGDWSYVKIQNDDRKQITFKFKSGSDNGTASWDGPSGGGNYVADYSAVITVQKSSGLNTSANVYATAPSGCAANVSAKNVEAKVSAAVYYEQGAADVVLANETVARTTACTKSEPNGDQLGVMCDINADAGKFEVKDLADGTYKLKEHEAPTGYTKTDVWYTFVISDGQVTTVTRHENADDATGTTVGAIEIVFTDTRTKVTWNKIDGTDKAKIAGSSWTIASGKVSDGSFTANGGTPITVTDCTSSCVANGMGDENADPGAFTVSGLPVNTNGEIYQLQEARNPTAHAGTPTYYFRLTDSNGDVTLYKDPALTVAASNIIENPRVLGEVSWSKVSSENDSLLLAGSEWKVTQTSEFKYGNDGVNGTFEKLATSKEYFVTDCMDACSSEGFADEDSSAGKFKLMGLPWGEYTLEENKAPDGYNLGGVVYKFTIGPSSYNGSAWSVALTVDGATGPADNKIENQPGVVLPGTGGDGNMKTLATGLLVAMASVATAGLALKVRRRRQ